MTRRRRRLIGLLSVGFVIVVWCIVTLPVFGPDPLVEPIRLPSPSAVLQAAATTRTRLVDHVLASLLRVVVSLVAGTATGVAVGMVVSSSAWVRAVVTPLVEVLRPCPPIALIPFVILNMGLGLQGEVVIIGLSVFMVMFITTSSAIDSVEPTRSLCARSLGASRLVELLAIVLPSVQQSLFAGLRVASAGAFTMTCAAEFMGAQSGIGYLIRNARITLNTDVILLGAFVLGILSWTFDLAIRAWRDRVTRWAPVRSNSKGGVL